MQICNFSFNTKGFTLIELLVTVILVAILASYSVYYYNNTIDEGKVNAAKGKLAALGGATARYFVENGEFASGTHLEMINATSDYDNCEQNDDVILDVFACGYAEPSLGREQNFNFFFGRPSTHNCGDYNYYTVFMIPKEDDVSSVFPICAYFNRDTDKVVEVK